jgi:hypothetical protein
MPRKAKQASRKRGANVRRSLWWQVGAILVAIAAVVGYVILDQSIVASGPDPSKLTGRWLRPDGGYVLALSNPTADGQLTATYSNPRPINVAGAEWKLQDDHLRVFVELRDTHYPGSTYMLVYQAGTDRLAGVYFQAALGQQFDVVFERMK